MLITREKPKVLPVTRTVTVIEVLFLSGELLKDSHPIEVKDPVTIEVSEKHLGYVDWKVSHFLYLIVSFLFCILCVYMPMHRST